MYGDDLVYVQIQREIERRGFSNLGTEAPTAAMADGERERERYGISVIGMRGWVFYFYF